MREAVASLDDPRLDGYRNVSDPRLLAERGCFMAEGRLLVSRLLASSRFATQSLMVTRTAGDALTGALALRPDVRVYEVSQQTMNQVTGLTMHRGCLAVGLRPPESSAAEITTGARRVLALERVGNADNVGALFRNAAAFGVEAVLLDRDTTDPLYRKALRTSMGAALQVPFARPAAWLDALMACRRAGMRLLALTPSPQALPLRAARAALTGERLVVLVGHEGEGLTEDAEHLCDLRVRVPMREGIDSLNVATAAAIALYEMAG